MLVTGWLILISKICLKPDWNNFGTIFRCLRFFGTTERKREKTDEKDLMMQTSFFKLK